MVSVLMTTMLLSFGGDTEIDPAHRWDYRFDDIKFLPVTFFCHRLINYRFGIIMGMANNDLKKGMNHG